MGVRIMAWFYNSIAMATLIAAGYLAGKEIWWGFLTMSLIGAITGFISIWMYEMEIVGLKRRRGSGL